MSMMLPETPLRVGRTIEVSYPARKDQPAPDRRVTRSLTCVTLEMRAVLTMIEQLKKDLSESTFSARNCDRAFRGASHFRQSCSVPQ